LMAENSASVEGTLGGRKTAARARTRWQSTGFGG